jgi:hypothetical protein
MIDDAKNETLKQIVIERSHDKNFRHHQWFVKYHLEIVEKIALELCGVYENANSQFVRALVWLHDYEKIVDFNNQYNTELHATQKLMEKVGYSPEVIQEMVENINLYNAKEDLDTACIEIQIVSSSDAASHLVGPFFTLYWYENPTLSIEELQSAHRKKRVTDWDKKITLPEIKKAFESRYQITQEVEGIFIPKLVQ